jgi:MFS family permease
MPVTSLHAPTPLPRSVWLLSWVSFFADVSSEMVYPLLPLFLVGVLGSSKVQLGVIEGAAVLLVAALSAYTGFRSDARGRRLPWIRWGYGLPILGKATIALATAWPMVLSGRLLDRLGKGLRGAPRDAMISDAISSDQRGRAFGLHRAFDTAGALLGVVLSAVLLWWLTGFPQAIQASAQAPAWVYRSIFAIAAALGAASLVLTLLLRETSGTDDPTDRTPPPVGPPPPLPRRYWLALGSLSLFALGNSSDAFLLLRAADLGFSPWTVVLAYAMFNVTYSALSYPAGLLSDRLGRWRVICLGWAIYAAVYLGFAMLRPAHAWGVWPFMAAYGLYMAMTDGVGKALIADCTPPARRGAAMGLFHMCNGVATLMASLLTGLAWDRWGPTPAFLIGAAAASAAIVAVTGLYRVGILNPASSD